MVQVSGCGVGISGLRDQDFGFGVRGVLVRAWFTLFGGSGLKLRV